MDENKFVSGRVEALSEQITILDSIEISVREAAAEYSELPNLPEIFKIIAETAEHCGTALERYWPDKLPPSDLSDRTARALGSISGVANALSLYSSIVKLRITAGVFNRLQLPMAFSNWRWGEMWIIEVGERAGLKNGDLLEGLAPAAA